jgi:hypothetical protein
VATFLLEVYAPSSASHPELVARLRSAAAELTAEGLPVRHLRSVLVPGDEVSFHLLEGPSPEAVERASVRAEIEFDRLVKAIA